MWFPSSLNSVIIFFLLQALYHALPMNYITVTKLQNKLEGEANLTTVRKLIDKMTQDGFVEAKSNRRLGTFNLSTALVIVLGTATCCYFHLSFCLS